MVSDIKRRTFRTRIPVHETKFSKNRETIVRPMFCIHCVCNEWQTFFVNIVNYKESRNVHQNIY